MTSPNTTCLPSSQSVLSHVRKNWEPLVFGPELAMESRPGGEEHVNSLHPGSPGQAVSAPGWTEHADALPSTQLIVREAVSWLVSVILHWCVLSFIQ